MLKTFMKTLNLILAASLCITTIGCQTVSPTQEAVNDIPIYLDDNADIELRVADALARMTLDEKVRILHAQSKFSSAGVPRLGIPDFWTDDGPHGVRPDVLWDEWEQAGQTNDSCIAFPALSCLAASFDTSAAALYGKVLGEEARYRSKDMILGPGVNICRTPLGGRNFEYLGEDPYLSSRMAVNYINGLQSTGVSACVKHFCLNNDEENRFNVNVIVSDRALREIYLPAFKAAAIEAHSWGIMGGYNLYKNQHLCHNSFILNDILKTEWKYDGVVVSDWGGTHDTDQAIENGLDMEFGTWTDGLHSGVSNAYDNYYLAKPYLDQIKSGKRTTKELDEKVSRILRLFFRTSMNSHRAHGFMNSEAHYDAAREIAKAGIVLLKNDNCLLPIDQNSTKRILVVGENAIKSMTVGGGSSSLKVQREISPLDGLKAALPNVTIDYARGYVGDPTGEYNGVTTGQNLNDNRTPEQLVNEALSKADSADYVILFGGLNKSDFQDCEGHDRKSYDLPYNQNQLIEALARKTDKLVYVNISGTPVAMPWVNQVRAIVQGWYLGSEAGNALADILVGNTSPSGKLPFTWYANLNDCAAHALNSYPGTWRKDKKIIDETYTDDIFVGYRWTERQGIKPLFPFGHGLSYTSFSMSNLSLNKTSLSASDKLEATVTIKNTGTRPGSETVLLFIADMEASVVRPLRELKGFAKVSLQPGESRNVKITIGCDALKFYDESSHSWTVEPGDFVVECQAAGNSLSEIITYK